MMLIPLSCSSLVPHLKPLVQRSSPVVHSANHCAEMFTTVSHISAYESEHLLKRKQEGVLPNGFE